MKYKFTIAYIVSIVLVNIGFVHVPLVPVLGTIVTLRTGDKRFAQNVWQGE